MINLSGKGRGFLFTISIIMFASTLLFFAQNYASLNNANEAAIVSSAKPIGAVQLNDDISFAFERIFDVAIDANYGASTSLFVSGSISSQPNISTAISAYETYLASSLFPLIFGNKSAGFSGVSDGTAEAYFGDNFEFDYDYSSQVIELFPKTGASVSQIDLNLFAHKDINGVVWQNGPVAGAAVLNLDYYDDSNHTVISQSFDKTSLSTLVIMYSDGNITIDFGSALADANSSLKISNFSGNKVEYSVKSAYSAVNPYPIYWNSFLVYSFDGFDSNSRILIRK